MQTQRKKKNASIYRQLRPLRVLALSQCPDTGEGIQPKSNREGVSLLEKTQRKKETDCHAAAAAAAADKSLVSDACLPPAVARRWNDLHTVYIL